MRLSDSEVFLNKRYERACSQWFFNEFRHERIRHCLFQRVRAR